MKNLFFDYLKIALIVSVVGIVLTSCYSAKIVDARPGKLREYRKIKNSTEFEVKIAADSCTDYVGRWNSNCWRCKDARVPENWNVLFLANGKYLIQDVK